MSDILNKTIVLVLNRNWQAINIRTPQDAFCQMATNVATALDIEGENYIRPVQWDEWITLPVRPQDNAVQTVRGPIRVPTVIVAVNFAKVPKKRPKLCSKTIRERDGNRCQYTGKLLKPDEGSLDHVLPRSRGAHGVVAFAHRQRDPLVPRDGTNVAFAFDVESGGHVRCHLAKRVLRRANVDRLPVAVEHQHDRLVQYVAHKSPGGRPPCTP